MNRDLLEKFCNTDESRPTLAEPWSEGQYTYATNGKILVRVPRLGDVPERADAPRNLSQYVFGGLPLAGIDFTAPRIPIGEDYDPCPSCCGSGTCTCRDCDASHECGKCRGSGQKLAYTPVGERQIATQALRLLRLLPDCAWQLQVSDRIYFRFDGGDGVVATSLPD